jgi:DNA-binding transcriptional MerR regulator
VADPLHQTAPHTGSSPEEAGASRDRQLTTGDMARLSNSTLRTVRFYEEEGILRPVARTEGGHRLFERTELARLLLVSDMRAAGLSLGEIKELLAMKSSAESGGAAAKVATRALAQRIRELDEKLGALTRLREDLVRTASVVAACLSCEGHEFFPEQCDRCAIIASEKDPPRALKVLWSVGEKPLGIVETAPAGETTKEPE